MLELQAFGPPDLRDGVEGGDLSSLLTQPKRLALLVYLALARPRGYQRRDTLLALFWPELDRTRGRRALSQSLFFLRQTLPEGIVQTRGNEEVGLDRAFIRTDVIAFEDAVDVGRWTEALELYHGDFLEGFHVSDVPELERWVDGERERLRELAAGAAWSLAMEQIEAGNLVPAERAGQRALHLVPTDESQVRRFIRALAAAGDRAAALRFYEKFAELLTDVLEVDPSAETAAVAAALRKGEAPGTSSPLPPLALPREREGTTDLQESGSSVLRRRRSPFVRPRITLGALVAGGLILVLATLFMTGREEPHLLPHRVAVLPFENRTGEEGFDDLGLVAADWLTAGLTGIDTVQAVSTSTVVAAAEAAEPQEDRIRDVARRTGAGLVITGSIFPARDSLEIRARLLDPLQSQVLGSFDPVRTPRSDPTGALGSLRQRILARIALRLDRRVEGLALVKEPDPPSYEAYRAYIRGVELFFQGRYPEAIQELDAAWTSDSTFLAPGIWIASGLGNMGRPAGKDSVVRLLKAHRGSLSDMERSAIDVMEAQLRGDHSTIYRLSRDGLRRQPTTEGRLHAGLSAFATNRPGEAVRALRSEPETGATRTRWLGFHASLTKALHVLGDHRQELDAAREARVRFPERVRAVFLEVRALAGSGRPDEALAMLREGMTLPPRERDWSPGELQLQAGLELRRHGYPEAGKQALRRGLRWLQTHQEGADYRYLMARGHLWLGQAAEAIPLLHELADEAPAVLEYHGTLGVALADAERRAEADSVLERLERWSEPYVRGRDLYWRAAIEARLGRQARAMALLRDAVGRGVSFADLHENEELRPLHDYPPFQAFLEPRG